MRNFFKRFVTRRRHIIIDESNIVNVLNVINESNKNQWRTEIDIGNCGWADSPKAWFIFFHCSDYAWDKFVKHLRVKRVWGNIEIPNKIGLEVYSDD